MNLSRYRHGGVNVTGFQLLERSPDSTEDLVRNIGTVNERHTSSHGLPVSDLHLGRQFLILKKNFFIANVNVDIAPFTAYIIR